MLTTIPDDITIHFLRDALRSGVTDIHRHTASKIFGVPEEEVTAEMRKEAKNVNYLVAYRHPRGQEALPANITRH